jgi:alpha-D-ribose 1-methylphosphonate 5-triphosphate synthase subunit PhnG
MIFGILMRLRLVKNMINEREITNPRESQMIDQTTRRRWMGVLARAPEEDLEETWNFFREKPDYYFLRSPETGLIMINGRIGAAGSPFPLGEATITRCTVQVRDGFQGTAYILGRNHRQAELAALFDSLLQDPCHHCFLMERIIERIEKNIQKEKEKLAIKTASTKVDFFTLVRGKET